MLVKYQKYEGFHSYIVTAFHFL